MNTRTQTFELLRGGKVVGHISKNSSDELVLSLKNYWGTINTGINSVNVDDFVGSVLYPDSKMNASGYKDNHLCVFDNNKYAGCTKIIIIVAGTEVCSVAVDEVNDVTGTVIISQQ